MHGTNVSLCPEVFELLWRLLHVVHVDLAIHLHHSHIVAEPVVIVHLRRLSRLKVALTSLFCPPAQSPQLEAAGSADSQKR